MLQTARELTDKWSRRSDTSPVGRQALGLARRFKVEGLRSGPGPTRRHPPPRLIARLRTLTPPRDTTRYRFSTADTKITTYRCTKVVLLYTQSLCRLLPDMHQAFSFADLLSKQSTHVEQKCEVAHSVAHMRSIYVVASLVGVASRSVGCLRGWRRVRVRGWLVGVLCTSPVGAFKRP